MKLFDFGLTIFVLVLIGIFTQGGYAIGKAKPESHNVVDAFIS